MGGLHSDVLVATVRPQLYPTFPASPAPAELTVRPHVAVLGQRGPPWHSLPLLPSPSSALPRLALPSCETPHPRSYLRQPEAGEPRLRRMCCGCVRKGSSHARAHPLLTITLLTVTQPRALSAVHHPPPHPPTQEGALCRIFTRDNSPASRALPLGTLPHFTFTATVGCEKAFLLNR